MRSTRRAAGGYWYLTPFRHINVENALDLTLIAAANEANGSLPGAIPPHSFAVGTI